MFEIALDETDNGVFQKDIAERQKISNKYLDNIITSLKTSGLIVNNRGRKSGYKLSRKASDIRILDIYKAFEPGINIVDCIAESYSCELLNTCSVRGFWLGLNDRIQDYFASYTLEDLISDHKSRSGQS